MNLDFQPRVLSVAESRAAETAAAFESMRRERDTGHAGRRHLKPSKFIGSCVSIGVQTGGKSGDQITRTMPGGFELHQAKDWR